MVDPLFGFIIWITADPSKAKTSDLGSEKDTLVGDTEVSSSARSDLVLYKWSFLKVKVDLVNFRGRRIL